MIDLDLLGAGVVLAWVGLPLLWLTARAKETEPTSRHRQLVTALGLACGLLLVPFAWSARPAAPVPPTSALAPLVERATEVLAPDDTIPPLSALALGWAVLTMVGAARAGLRVWRLARILKRARPAAEDDCVLALKLARERGLPTPRLLISDEVAVPCAASLWRPAIVLPTGLRERLQAEAFTCVLRHELAHLDRGDQGWVLAVALLRIPFTLHPLGPRFAADISLAREEAVDAVVAQTDAYTYAHALVEVAAQASRPDGPGFPEAVFMSASALSRRVTMLTNPRRLRPASWWSSLLVATIVAAAAFAAPRPQANDAPAAPQGHAEMGTPVKVAKGATTRLTIPGMKRVAIGDAAIADVRTSGSSALQITGLSPGKTTLLVWTAGNTRTAYLVTVE